MYNIEDFTAILGEAVPWVLPILGGVSDRSEGILGEAGVYC